MQTSKSEFEIPQNDNIDLASLIPAENLENFKFERDDWMLFRSLNTLPQKAGVPLNRMVRLVLKELVDNALDAGGNVSIREEDGTYIIKDDGPGLDGDPEDIARLFSIRRPLITSKLWRMPTRGALGNGLRVCAGAVLASGGRLSVTTRNRRHVLTPKDDGSTAVEAYPADYPVGTRIEIAFGPDMPRDYSATEWAELAITLAHGETYGGKTSPYWYDADSFWELLQAAGTTPVRALIEKLDGCSGARAGTIAADYRATPCAALDRGHAVALLGAARSHARPVNPKRLGSVGEVSSLPSYYAIETDTAEIGARNPKAIIPFVVEAWVGHELGRIHIHRIHNMIAAMWMKARKWSARRS